MSTRNAGPGAVAATFRSPNERTYSKPWLRKNNRLTPDVYAGNGAFFLTMVTAERQTRFTSDEATRTIEAALKRSAEESHYELLAYVFMPEHLHALVHASDEAVLSRFLKDFKQRTAFHFKRERGATLWQKGSYDHVMRQEEDLESAALYIAMNPVRRGLVTDWTLYPYWGGSLLRNLAGDLKVASTLAPAAGGLSPE